MFIKTYLIIVGLYGFLSWHLGTGLGINFNFWFLSIALWVITEVLQSLYTPILRILSGFVGIGVMSVFGVFPNEIFTNLDQYWWIALFWIPAIFINKKSDYSKRYTPWFWLGVFFYVSAFIIWLNTPIDTLVKRVGNAAKRPMIKGDVRKAIKDLLSQRIKYYSICDYKLDTNDLVEGQILNKILTKIRSQND